MAAVAFEACGCCVARHRQIRWHQPKDCTTNAGVSHDGMAAAVKSDSGRHTKRGELRSVSHRIAYTLHNTDWEGVQYDDEDTVVQQNTDIFGSMESLQKDTICGVCIGKHIRSGEGQVMYDFFPNRKELDSSSSESSSSSDDEDKHVDEEAHEQYDTTLQEAFQLTELGSKDRIALQRSCVHPKHAVWGHRGRFQKAKPYCYAATGFCSKCTNVEHRRGKEKAEEEAGAAVDMTAKVLRWNKTIEMAAKKASATQALLASQSASAPMEGTGTQQPAAAPPPPPPPPPPPQRASTRLGNLMAHMQSPKPGATSAAVASTPRTALGGDLAAAATQSAVAAAAAGTPYGSPTFQGSACS